MYINDIVRKRKKNNRKEEVDEGETNSVMLVPYASIPPPYEFKMAFFA